MTKIEIEWTEEENDNIRDKKEEKGLKDIILYVTKKGKATEAQIYHDLGMVSRSTIQYRINKLEKFDRVKRTKDINGHHIRQNFVVIIDKNVKETKQ